MNLNTVTALRQPTSAAEIAQWHSGFAWLYRFEAPREWFAAPLIRACCNALLASFKIWNAATVGGNICMSLPAGAMISLTTALQGVCVIWSPNGSERRVPIEQFVTGNQQNVLQPGELLR